MAKISVIIPVYNVEKYLVQCLNSVIYQTFKDIEILCINDGSTDNSLTILEQYARKDSRIKIISKKNQGLGAARNTGILYASGDYLYFLDSDDWLDFTCLEKLYNKIIENNSDVCVMGTNSFIEETQQIYVNDYYNANLYELDENLFFTRSEAFLKLYKHSYFKKHLKSYPEKIWYEDVLVSIKGYLLTTRITILRENLYYYRVRSNSIMNNSKNSLKVLDIFTVIKSVEDFLQSSNLLETYKLTFIEFVLNQLNYHQKRITNRNNRKIFNERIKNYMKNLNAQDTIRSNKKLNNLYNEIFPSFRYLLSKNLFSIETRKEIHTERLIITILGIKLKMKKKASVERNNKKFEKLINNTFKSLVKYIPETNVQQVLTNNTDAHINKSLKQLDEFYFLPNQGNLGDIVISFSEFQYFDSNKFNYKCFDVSNLLKNNRKFNLVYGGGGLWHSLYKPYYQNILNIFKSSNLKKCVILPSSFYDCEDVLEVLDERFTVFCREEQSFDYCIKLNNKANFILADDMVINANFEELRHPLVNKSALLQANKMVLDGIENIADFYSNVVKKALHELKQYSNFEVGYLLRNDNESVFKKSHIIAKNIDPSGFAGGHACDNALNTLLTKLFLTIISQFDIVITDRLHIGICAAKLGKKTLLIDNSYKKLSNVYNNSMKGFSNVQVVSADDLEKAIALAKKNIVPSAVLPLEDIVNISDNFLLNYASIKNEYGCEKNFWG